MYVFRNDLGIPFHLLSAKMIKTVKKVNPKWTKISDEIEKHTGREVIVFLTYLKSTNQAVYINFSIFSLLYSRIFHIFRAKQSQAPTTKVSVNGEGVGYL